MPVAPRLARLALGLPVVLAAVGCSGAEELSDEPVAEVTEQALGANLLPNPSFETGTTGWSSWQGTLTRVQRSGAPNGAYVARIAAARTGGYSLDDAPDTVRATTAGKTYTASATVASASSSANGKRISLIIREKTTAGATVHLGTATTTLSSAFQRLTVTKKVQSSGNVLDVYVYQEGAAIGDAFLADAISLADADAPPPPSPSGPSGVAMPVGDLPGWRQVFTDDFTTNVPLGSFPAAVSTKWGAYLEGWKDTSKNGTYSPGRVVSIHDGVLDKYLHSENGVPLVAALTPKLPANMSAGRYAIRFKADPVPRYKTAWLLWPDSEVWPRDGEIDFPEGDLDGTIHAFMHRQNGTSGGDQDAYSTTARYTSWHTAILEWSPGRCAFILDGNTIGVSTSRVPSTPMHWVIQTETALSGEKPTGSGHVLIDWVAVWVPR